METKNAKIAALASYLPEKVLNNHDLEKIVDTNNEWIVTRTGIEQRHIAAEDESASDMGAKAFRKLQQVYDIQPEDIDLIIVPTSTPDMIFPATACLIQTKIGAKNAATFDMSAACSGYVYAFDTAVAFIESGQYKNVLILAVEKYSTILDWSDRSTCVLFGDGANATLMTVSDDDESKIVSMSGGSDGSKTKQLYIPAGGSRMPVSMDTVKDKLSTVKMQGTDVFRTAIVRFRESIENVITKSGISKDDIKLIVPHQANIRIIKALAKDMGLSMDLFFANIQKYGNTSAASIGIALEEAALERDLKKGDYIIITSFGAGFSWGATLIKW